MYHEQEHLESLGYHFEVDEEPVTSLGADGATYFVITISYKGEMLGTRSEMTLDRAMERAIEFAQKYEQGVRPKGTMPKGWTDRPTRG